MYGVGPATTSGSGSGLHDDAKQVTATNTKAVVMRLSPNNWFARDVYRFANFYGVSALMLRTMFRVIFIASGTLLPLAWFSVPRSIDSTGE